MTPKLCLLTCSNFRRELEAAVAAEGWPDLDVRAFPARCGRPPVSWQSLRSALPPDCAEAVLMGRSCLSELRQVVDTPEPRLQILTQEQCFHLVAPAEVVDAAIAGGAYVVTPIWLRNWRERLGDLGLSHEDLRAYFHEFAAKLVLLDTGVDADAAIHLSDMGSFLDLPVERVAVGLAHMRAQLRAIVQAEQRRDSPTDRSAAHDGNASS